MILSGRRDRSIHTDLTDSMVSTSPASSRENSQFPRNRQSQSGPSSVAPSVQGTLTSPSTGNYPALPAEATLQRLLDVLKDAKQTALTGVPGDKRKIILNRRNAHAGMIDGVYGIEAASPCERCKTKGRACRVYHPSIFEQYARFYGYDTN